MLPSSHYSFKDKILSPQREIVGIWEHCWEEVKEKPLKVSQTEQVE